jgi:hypothetical protein
VSNTWSRRGCFAAVLAIFAALLAVVGVRPATATVVTTSGISTVTQAPLATTPGFSTPCTVSGKPQNCAAIRAFKQVGSVMFAGGSFQTILAPNSSKPMTDPSTGQPLTGLNNLVALDTTNSDAVLTTFKHTFNGAVLALAASTDGNTLYVGGEFTKVDGKQQLHLAAFDLRPATYGKLLPAFTIGGKATVDPLIKNAANALRGRVRSLLVGPSLTGATGSSGPSATLYVGGDFVSALGSTVQQLVAIDTATGTLVPTFTPNITVNTDPTLLYCGNFQPVPAAKQFSQVWSLALSNDGTTNRLYVSGHFDFVDGNAQTALTAVDPASGRWDSTFRPQPTYQTSAVNASTGQKQNCYDYLHTGNQVTPVDSAGGTRTPGVLLAQAGHYNCSYRFNIDGTGGQPNNPKAGGWIARPGGDSQSILIVGHTVYIGGHFICWSTDNQVGLGRSDCLADLSSTVVPKASDVQRVHLAVVNYDTGATDMSWAPMAQPSTYSPYYYGVWALALDDQNQLWAGGVFQNVRTPDGTVYTTSKLAIFPVLASGAGPTAWFTPTACKINTSCKFTAWPTVAPGSSSALTYAWDFGDGTTAAASSVTTVNHTYTTSGAFTVTVTVDDGTGLPGHTYVATNVIHVPGTTTPPAPSA